MSVYAESVYVGHTHFFVELKDGRLTKVPWGVTARLSRASLFERLEFRFIGNGQGIHWPMLDEDLSVALLFDTYKECAHV